MPPRTYVPDRPQRNPLLLKVNVPGDLLAGSDDFLRPQVVEVPYPPESRFPIPHDEHDDHEDEGTANGVRNPGLLVHC